MAGRGRPLGVFHPALTTGVSPALDDPAPASPGELAAFAATPIGRTNYRSAELEPDVCEHLLQHMIDQGWAKAFGTWDELTEHLGSTEVVLSKFALISKEKPDGTVKHRLI